MIFNVTTILADIEGTTSSVPFVKDILFPYAAANVEDYLKAELHHDPSVCDLIDQLRSQASTEKDAPQIPKDGSDDVIIKAVANYVTWLMDQDRKLPPLKDLQGRILRQAYEGGKITGHVYPDVPRNFEAWRSKGVKIYCYSSGSVEAQKLLFKFSLQGDILSLFDGHFDATIGNKKVASSYTKIAEAIGEDPSKILFLTDIDEEANAAVEAGMQIAILDRPGNGPISDEFIATNPPIFDTFDKIPVQYAA